LIDVLQEQFSDRMDTNCISLMGHSGGGTATAYAAALEPRLSLAMPCCAMCAYTASIGAVAHCTCNYVPGIAEYFDMGDLMAMACPMPFVQVSGVHDTDFLFRGAQDVFAQGKRAYDGIGASDRCVFVRGEEGHRFYADQAWPWVHQLLKK
jgi:pimeloyl-ACP methyl ester carboxylesterase